MGGEVESECRGEWRVRVGGEVESECGGRVGGE